MNAEPVAPAEPSEPEVRSRPTTKRPGRRRKLTSRVTRSPFLVKLSGGLIRAVTRGVANRVSASRRRPSQCTDGVTVEQWLPGRLASAAN